MARAVLLLLGCLLVGGCSSPREGSRVVILEREQHREATSSPSGELAPSAMRDAEKEGRVPGSPEDAKPVPPPCKHVWLQRGMNLVQDRADGPGNTQFCVITQCPKCGEVRHECQRRRARK
jgi:hypothetical protein